MIINETHIIIWNLLKIHPRGLCVKDLKILMIGSSHEDIKSHADELVAAGRLTFSTYNDHYKVSKTAGDLSSDVKPVKKRKKSISKEEAKQIRKTILTLASTSDGILFTDIHKQICEQVPCESNAYQYLHRLLKNRSIVKRRDPGNRSRCLYYATGFEPDNSKNKRVQSATTSPPTVAPAG